MKKSILLLAAVFVVGSIFAQGRGRGMGQQRANGQQKGMRDRSQQTKNPSSRLKAELTKQQADFMNLLSEKEKTKIESLQAKANELFDGKNQVNDVEQQRAFRDNIYDLRKQSEKIADKYPEQSAKYTKEISTFMEPLSDNPSRSNGKGQNGNAKSFKGQRMAGFNDAAWLLIWNPDRQMPMRSMNTARNNDCNSNLRGNRASFASETRDEIKAYVAKNIIPAIAEKRKKFDANLTESEKKEIIFARGKLMARNAMYKQWSESEDFVPGQRRNDTTLDNFRAEMQKSMQAMRSISINHQAEIEAIRDGLESESVNWKKDIKTILDEEDVDMALSREIRKNMIAMAFILMDPENPSENIMMSGPGKFGKGHANGRGGRNGRGNGNRRGNCY